MKIFAILDVKANHFLQPFTDSSTVSALRGFDAAVNEGKSVFSRFPDDFCLCELAHFEQATGEIIPHKSPLNLGSARTVLRQPEFQHSLPGMKALNSDATSGRVN